MTREELRDLLRQPEGERLELERDLGDGRVFAATVAAFANTSGGTLVVGVDGRDPPGSALSDAASTAADARARIESSVSPVPPFEAEVVEVEPGQSLVVVRVAPGEERPYVANGRILERRGDRLAPITSRRITQTLDISTVGFAAMERLAETIAQESQVVERLEAQLHWRRQLPLQVALVLFGAVIGYVLAVWNPLGG